MRATLLVALCLTLAGIGYRYAQGASVEPADVGPAFPGHYAAHLHRPAFDAPRLSCLMLSPLEKEWVPKRTPDGFVLRTSAKDSVARYRSALGPMPAGFADAWRSLGEERGPLRVLVKRYARPKLPGQCVTVIASFYTVPDPFIGGRYHGNRDGLLFEVRKTVQLANGAARLVEASVEAHRRIVPGPERKALAAFVGDPNGDPREVEHFESLGGGERRAWYWLDRSWGIGTPKPDDNGAWAIRVNTTKQGRAAVEAKPLGLEDAAALRAVAERA